MHLPSTVHQTSNKKENFPVQGCTKVKNGEDLAVHGYLKHEVLLPDGQKKNKNFKLRGAKFTFLTCHDTLLLLPSLSLLLN